MSADRLREAARVLRERAEAATPGPWWSSLSDYNDLGGDVIGVTDAGMCSCDYSCSKPDATFIATMHPGVALAVAGWLDYEANRVSRTIDGVSGHAWHVPHPSALAVADAILGGTQ